MSIHKLIAFLFLPSLLWAGGPYFQQKDQNVQQEFEQAYREIRAVPNGIYKSSSMTLQGLTVDSVTVNSQATVKGNLTFSPTTAGIKGTTTNDAATAGNVGEYISSCVSVINAATSGQWVDVTSVSLTPGDYIGVVNDLGAVNGATITRMLIGIGKTSGNNGPDILGTVPGGDELDLMQAISGAPPGGTLPGVRISIASTIPVYFKGFSTYTGGPPQFRGCIAVTRVR